MDIKEIIENEFGIIVTNISILGQGLDSIAYRVNNEYIFKMSKHNEARENLKKEIKVLNYLKGKVSLQIPTIEFYSEKYSVCGYKENKGEKLTKEMYASMSLEEQEDLAHSIAQFLKELHSLPIPDIERFYFKLAGSISLIAKSNKNEEEDYTLFGNVIDEEIRKIFIAFALMGDPVPDLEDFWCCTTMRTEEYFDKNIFNRNNVFYKDYMNIPEKFEEGIKDINISFYCYLLIMSYGMMVRYNANIWEKYIDKKNSSYSTLIELSIPNAVINFYYQMHYLLFGFYYENDSYSENDIKKMIDASTVDIMNNITKEIKSNSFRNNERVILPWKEKVR